MGQGPHHDLFFVAAPGVGAVCGVLPRPEAEANARLIVRACNNHDELLDCLKGLTDAFNTARLLMSDEARALAAALVDDALSVIAKAEK